MGHLVILKAAECIFRYSNDQTKITKKSINWTKSFIPSLSFILLIILIILFMFNSSVARDTKEENEFKSVEPNLSLNDENNPWGLLKTVTESEPEVKSLKDIKAEAPPFRTSIKLSIEDSTKLKSGRENINSANESNLKPLKRARTDINIHDPNKPIPSVLNHPIVDKNGNKLKRIFIPGRGWVSNKLLRQEREDLLKSFSSATTLTTENIPY